MVVVLLVSMTSNVETRMVVNHTVEPPERMESKRHGCNLPDVLFADIFTKRVKLSPLATELDSYSIPTSFGGNVRILTETRYNTVVTFQNQPCCQSIRFTHFTAMQSQQQRRQQRRQQRQQRRQQQKRQQRHKHKHQN